MMAVVQAQVVPATTKSSKFATSEASEAVCRTCSSLAGRPVGRLHAVCRSGGCTVVVCGVESRAGRARRWPHFAVEARISLFVAIVLFVLERQRVRKQEEQGSGKRLQPCRLELILVLVALFLTVLGQFALQPALETAKAGQPGRLSFGALHGISASLF